MNGQPLPSDGIGPTIVSLFRIQRRDKPRNKPIHLWLTDFQQGYQGNSVEKNSVSTNGARTNSYSPAKELPHTLYKIN